MTNKLLNKPKKPRLKPPVRIKLDGTPAKSNAGRPPKQFTDEQIACIDEKALHQSKDNTIAVEMGIEIETFRKHFSKRCEQKRAEGKNVCHKMQYEQMQKNPVMAIWWGKQHLGQTDRADVTSKVEGLAAPVVLVMPPKGTSKAEAAETGENNACS